MQIQNNQSSGAIGFGGGYHKEVGQQINAEMKRKAAIVREVQANISNAQVEVLGSGSAQVAMNRASSAFINSPELAKQVQSSGLSEIGTFSMGLA